MIVRTLSPSAVLRRAVADRRWGVFGNIVFGRRSNRRSTVFRADPSLMWTNVT